MDIETRREANSYFLSRAEEDLRHDISVVFASACIMLVLLYACGGIISLLVRLWPPLGAEKYTVTIQLVFYVLSLVLPSAFAAKLARRRPAKLFPVKAVMPKNIFSFLALSAGITYCVNFVCNLLFSELYPYTEGEGYTTAFGSAVAVIMIVLLAPVLEELFFRGAVFGTLANYSPLFAVIVSALVFGLSHRNPPQVINASVMGLFLALGYLKTGSVAVCVFMHLLNNAASVAAQFTAYFANENVYAFFFAFGIIAAGVFSLAIIIKAAIRRRRSVIAFDDPPLACPRFPRSVLVHAVAASVPFWAFVVLVAAGVWMLYI